MKMDKEQIKQHVVTVCAKVLERNEDDIDLSVSLVQLGADSLDSIEIVMRLEEKLNVQINDEKFETLNAINELIDYICELG